MRKHRRVLLPRQICNGLRPRKRRWFSPEEQVLAHFLQECDE
jgi:hypothetical protein